MPFSFFPYPPSLTLHLLERLGHAAGPLLQEVNEASPGEGDESKEQRDERPPGEAEREEPVEPERLLPATHEVAELAAAVGQPVQVDGDGGVVTGDGERHCQDVAALGAGGFF